MTDRNDDGSGEPRRCRPTTRPRQQTPSPDPDYLKPAGFLLDPAGTVLVSRHPDGPLGPVEDLIAMIRHVRCQTASA